MRVRTHTCRMRRIRQTHTYIHTCIHAHKHTCALGRALDARVHSAHAHARAGKTNTCARARTHATRSGEVEGLWKEVVMLMLERDLGSKQKRPTINAKMT